MSQVTPQKLHAVNVQKPLTLPLNNRLSVRLYADCRPHCMETAALQKGLVLMLDGKELVEEGLGFGVPIAKYKDKTYFSSSAQVSVQETDGAFWVRKIYVLDAVSKKIWRGSYIDDGFYSSWRKRFAKLYLSRKELSPLFNRIMEFRELAKIRTEFVKVNPRGLVTVNYIVQPKVIDVSVDFADLTLNGCEELLVLNEQGSTIFDRYSDTNGLKLRGNRIGGWGAVTARQASLYSGEGQVVFSLYKKSDAALFRGWERTRNRFSWAGLSYSLSPIHQAFNYKISVSC